MLILVGFFSILLHASKSGLSVTDHRSHFLSLTHLFFLLLAVCVKFKVINVVDNVSVVSLNEIVHNNLVGLAMVMGVITTVFLTLWFGLVDKLQ